MGNNLLAYTTAKLSVNASSNIELFGKVGVGINQMKFGSGLQPHFANQSSHSFIGPVYAIGSNYKISNHHNFAINLQYIRFGQSWTTWSAVHHTHANAMDLITVGVNYSFAA